jgi:hypothetical protein
MGRISDPVVQIQTIDVDRSAAIPGRRGQAGISAESLAVTRDVRTLVETGVNSGTNVGRTSGLEAGRGEDAGRRAQNHQGQAGEPALDNGHHFLLLLFHPSTTGPAAEKTVSGSDIIDITRRGAKIVPTTWKNRPILALRSGKE